MVLPVRYLAMIFVLAAVMRLINLATIGDVAANTLVEDSTLYWNGAKHWLDAGFFAVPWSTGYRAETERVPLYFLFLIPFRWLFDLNVVPALIAQALLDSATCVVLARLGSMVDRTTGIVVGLLSVTWLNFVIHSTLVLSDTLFVFLLSLTLLYAARFVHRVKLSDVALAGIFCGLAIMTRTVALFLPVAMAFAAPFITSHRGVGWRPGFTAAVIILVLASLPAIPIVHRNVTQFDTVQLTDQKGTFMLYWIVGISQSLASGKPFDTVSAELNAKLKSRYVDLGTTEANLHAFERSQVLLDLAQEELKAMRVGTLLYAWAYGAIKNLAEPALALEPRIRARNTNSFYNAQGQGFLDRIGNFVKNNDPTYVTWLSIGIVGGGIALLLQAYGCLLLFRRMFWPAVLGSLCILYFLLINGPVGGPKYRLPFEPVLIVFMAVAVIDLASRLQRLGTLRRRRQACFASQAS